MSRPLHVILGDQTAKKLDEIAQATEENKTALIHRLIREEWQRQRELQPPVIATVSQGEWLLADLAAGEISGEVARDRILALSSEIKAPGEYRFDGTDRDRVFIASPDGQNDRVL